MRKSVLFIAKFDNILKGMNTILSNTFNMQMCPPEPGMVEKTLEVMEIDLVLLYISGLSEKLLGSLSGRLAKVCLQVPIVVFGTDAECKEFDRYCAITIGKYIHRPLAAQDIVKAIQALFDQNAKAASSPPSDQPPAQSSPQTPPQTSPPSVPAITPNMSLVDFADALDRDERRCILLVDDDGRILRAMKLLLEQTYRVNLANSAISALDSIQRDRPDAVLLDYEMPTYDGKATLKMIRENSDTRNLPVFFLTGVADKQRVQEVIHLKPQGYLLKNSEQSVILGALEKFFNDSDNA